LKSSASTVIEANLGEYHNKYGNDQKYTGYLSSIQSLDLTNISETDVQRSIQNFLYDWGRMGRALGRDEFSGWQSKIASILRDNWRQLYDFRFLDLSLIGLNDYIVQVCELYASIRPLVGPIGSAKILHVLCPTFFPLWDNAIEKGMRAEYYDRSNQAYDSFSAMDYFQFMKATQIILHRYEDIWTPLAAQSGKSKLKLVDECLWWMVIRPFSLVVPDNLSEDMIIKVILSKE
jgi:hypothetical protein